MAQLLIHTDDVPPAVRASLEAALRGPRDQRCDNLVSAATGLYREAGLDCDDARELVGLDDCGLDDCGCDERAS